MPFLVNLAWLHSIRTLISGTSEVGVDALTQSELVFTRSDSQMITISVVNNDVYDGAEQRTFNVCIALLGSDFERVDFVSECIEVSIKDDEVPPEGVCVCVCVCARLCLNE